MILAQNATMLGLLMGIIFIFIWSVIKDFFKRRKRYSLILQNAQWDKKILATATSKNRKPHKINRIGQ